jgi:hypothetical protein
MFEQSMMSMSCCLLNLVMIIEYLFQICEGSHRNLLAHEIKIFDFITILMIGYFYEYILHHFLSLCTYFCMELCVIIHIRCLENYLILRWNLESV